MFRFPYRGTLRNGLSYLYSLYVLYYYEVSQTLNWCYAKRIIMMEYTFTPEQRTGLKFISTWLWGLTTYYPDEEFRYGDHWTGTPRSLYMRLSAKCNNPSYTEGDKVFFNGLREFWFRNDNGSADVKIWEIHYL